MSYCVKGVNYNGQERDRKFTEEKAAFRYYTYLACSGRYVSVDVSSYDANGDRETLACFVA